MPTIKHQLGFGRLYGTTALGGLGQAIPSLTMTAAQLGGFFANPILPPYNMDRSRDARLWLTIFSTANPGPAAGNVQLDVGLTLARPGIAVVDAVHSLVQAVPAAWAGSQRIVVEVLNAGGPLIPGRTLERDTLIGLRFARNGPAVADTWTGSLGLVTAAWLEYSEDCRFGSCL